MEKTATERLVELLAQSGVMRFKNSDFEIEFQPAPAAVPVQVRELASSTPTPPSHLGGERAPAPETGAAIPPVESKIPHHVNEVANMLRLSDNELAERLFPDFSQPPSEDA